MISRRLKKNIRKIMSGISFERCLLFGSQARDNARPDSDYDFLLIVNETMDGREKISLASSLRKKCADIGIDADFIIKSNEEIEYFRRKPGHIVRNALAESVAIC